MTEAKEEQRRKSFTPFGVIKDCLEYTKTQYKKLPECRRFLGSLNAKIDLVESNTEKCIWEIVEDIINSGGFNSDLNRCSDDYLLAFFYMMNCKSWEDVKKSCSLIDDKGAGCLYNFFEPNGPFPGTPDINGQKLIDQIARYKQVLGGALERMGTAMFSSCYPDLAVGVKGHLAQFFAIASILSFLDLKFNEGNPEFIYILDEFSKGKRGTKTEREEIESLASSQHDPMLTRKEIRARRIERKSQKILVPENKEIVALFSDIWTNRDIFDPPYVKLVLLSKAWHLRGTTRDALGENKIDEQLIRSFLGISPSNSIPKFISVCCRVYISLYERILQARSLCEAINSHFRIKADFLMLNKGIKLLSCDFPCFNCCERGNCTNRKELSYSGKALGTIEADLDHAYFYFWGKQFHDCVTNYLSDWGKCGKVLSDDVKISAAKLLLAGAPRHGSGNSATPVIMRSLLSLMLSVDSGDPFLRALRIVFAYKPSMVNIEKLCRPLN